MLFLLQNALTLTSPTVWVLENLLPTRCHCWMCGTDILDELYHWAGTLVINNLTHFQFFLCFMFVVEDVIAQFFCSNLHTCHLLPCLPAMMNFHSSGTVSKIDSTIDYWPCYLNSRKVTDRETLSICCHLMKLSEIRMCLKIIICINLGRKTKISLKTFKIFNLNYYYYYYPLSFFSSSFFHCFSFIFTVE